MANKCSYTKNQVSVELGWVTYFKFSNYESFNFTVRFNKNGDVDVLSSMAKRESKDGSFYISDKVLDGEITEQEFNEALAKTFTFLSKKI